MTVSEEKPGRPPRRVSLALQGGGTMGAYSWGVLDTFLERDHFEFAGVTGASAGALNAALLADGFARDGAAGARAQLESFWLRLSAVCAARRRSRFSGAFRSLRDWVGSVTAATVHDVAGRALADFEFDPQTMEPLRGAIASTIDFSQIPRAPFPVFVNATDVRTFAIKVFEAAEIDVDVLCASSCVPLVFDAVEIGGEHYWDGAFLGNPALFPIITGCDASDIVLVRTAPRSPSLPKDGGDLLARISELSFSAALARERRAIDFVSDLVRQSPEKIRPGLREIRIHDVPPHPELGGWKGRAFDASESNLRRLHALGREASASWLDGFETSAGSVSQTVARR